MRKELHLAAYIKEYTDLDIFDNTRKREYVEFRALYNYILHNIMKKSLTWIRNNYIANGTYQKYNPKIMPLFNELCKVRDSPDEKIAFVDTALRHMRKDEVEEVSNLVHELLTQNIRNEAAKNIEVQAE